MISLNPTSRMETVSLKPLPAFEIPLNSITVRDRVRKDFGDIEDLAASIARDGLVQPIVVTSDHVLVAGERRLRAHKRLGYPTIKAIYIEVLDEAHRTILEATENIVRRDFTWQETVVAIDKVHRLKNTENALRGEAWGVRETGRLINQSKSNVGRAVLLASLIHANDPDIMAAESVADAFRVLAKREEDRLSAALVKSTLPTADKGKVVSTKRVVEEVGDGDFFAGQGSTGFVPGIGGIIDLDERPVSGSGDRSVSVVPLSQMFFRADAVEWCRAQPSETFDAVITDWPYGIEMDNIQQDGGGKDVSTTTLEHGVEDNKRLQRDVVPLIYKLLKPSGWFITWTDFALWNEHVGLCGDAGFAVQRWPLIWHKTSSSQNMAAQYNFTKNYEIAVVCRKGGATLLRPQASSVWTGGSDIEAKALGHPFAKPFALWEWILNATCVRGARVLDPFVGCGSSVVPMLRMGLKPTGVEVNEKHFNSLIVNAQNFYKSLDPNCTFT